MSDIQTASAIRNQSASASKSQIAATSSFSDDFVSMLGDAIAKSSSELKHNLQNSAGSGNSASANKANESTAANEANAENAADKAKNDRSRADRDRAYIDRANRQGEETSKRNEKLRTQDANAKREAKERVDAKSEAASGEASKIASASAFAKSAASAQQNVDQTSEASSSADQSAEARKPEDSDRKNESSESGDSDISAKESETTTETQQSASGAKQTDQDDRNDGAHDGAEDEIAIPDEQPTLIENADEGDDDEASEVSSEDASDSAGQALASEADESEEHEENVDDAPVVADAGESEEDESDDESAVKVAARGTDVSSVNHRRDADATTDDSAKEANAEKTSTFASDEDGEVISAPKESQSKTDATAKVSADAAKAESEAKSQDAQRLDAGLQEAPKAPKTGEGAQEKPAESGNSRAFENAKQQAEESANAKSDDDGAEKTESNASKSNATARHSAQNALQEALAKQETAVRAGAPFEFALRGERLTADEAIARLRLASIRGGEPTNAEAKANATTSATTSDGLKSSDLGDRNSQADTGRDFASDLARGGQQAFSSSRVRTQMGSYNQQNIQRIAEMVQNMRRNAPASVRLHLTPPRLGSVQVELRVRAGELHAKIVTENAGTRHLLLQNRDALIKNLQDHGIDLGSLDINLSSSDAGETNQDDFTAAERAANAGIFGGLDRDEDNEALDVPQEREQIVSALDVDVTG
ncbi:MAG: flagellar hook-length control protein FliK [Planctomycetes bacterium]|nr:flagellar hook-length control protein FliK [Planctomycetota bacterium]